MPDKVKPLFKKKPAGPSKRRWSGYVTHGPVTCQLCGTKWPEAKEGKDYAISQFLDWELIEECCGAVIDRLYEKFGIKFSMASSYDFNRDPFNPQFQPFHFATMRAF